MKYKECKQIAETISARRDKLSAMINEEIKYYRSVISLWKSNDMEPIKPFISTLNALADLNYRLYNGCDVYKIAGEFGYRWSDYLDEWVLEELNTPPMPISKTKRNHS